MFTDDGVRYTSSELFEVRTPPLSRRFIPASQKGRWVVGVRVYGNDECYASPSDPGSRPEVSYELRGFLTLIDAYTAQPIAVGIPIRRLSMFAIGTITKTATPTAGGTTTPVLFPLAMPRRCNVAGSWIYNEQRGSTTITLVEFFYND